MDKEPIKYDKCPACGSTNRYCESLGNQEKARGHMKKDLCLAKFEGICKDDELFNTLPYGTTVPSFIILTDVCVDCGNIYVTSINEGKAVKQSQLIVPKPNFPANPRLN